MNKADEATERRKWLGVVLGLLSAACYGGMYYLVHSASGNVPATEITFFRAVIVFLFSSPVAWTERRRLFSAASGPVWIRSGANALSIICLSWNLQHASIGFANLLFNLAPLVVLALGIWTGAIARNASQTICMVLIVVGTVFFFPLQPVSSYLTPMLVGLIGAAAAGIHYTMLEKQSLIWKPWVLIWPLGLISLPMSFALKQGAWVSLSHSTFLPLIGTGLLCLVGQYLVIVSLRFAGLAIGTALVPSAVAFGVFADATAGRVGFGQLLGCGLYLLGLMPLIGMRYKSSPKLNSESAALEAA